VVIFTPLSFYLGKSAPGTAKRGKEAVEKAKYEIKTATESK
jgi:hypothetical protein